MTSSHRSAPGDALLRFARRLFPEPVVKAVIEPAVADFQREVAEEGRRASVRMLVWFRGYLSIWSVLLIVPFCRNALVRPVTGGPVQAPAPSDRGILAVVVALCVPLAAILYSLFGGGPLAVVVAAGCSCALLLRLWHDRHPTEIPSSETRSGGLEVRFTLVRSPEHTAGVLLVAGWIVLFVGAWMPWLAVALVIGSAATAVAVHQWHERHPVRVIVERRGAPRHPEINFAAIQVMENMAGLLVVVGGVAIIAAGLPAFQGFLLLNLLGGAAVAAVLGRWRLTHPVRLDSQTSIAPR